MPADNQPKPETESISHKQECVGGKSRIWLFRFLIVCQKGILHGLWTVRVVIEVFAQSRRQMPDTYCKKRQKDGTSNETQSPPKLRLNHRYKKRGKKQ